jgi:hypothetical protein
MELHLLEKIALGTWMTRTACSRRRKNVFITL